LVCAWSASSDRRTSPNRLLAIPDRPEVVAAIWSELRAQRLVLDLYDLEAGESLDALLAADGWYHFTEPADLCMTILPHQGLDDPPPTRD
jgi:hypothetical protein